MSLKKYASFDSSRVLEIKGAPTRLRTASLDKLSEYDDYRTDQGYLYVRITAISSRTNANNDGWPSIELAGGKEVFDKHRKHSSEGGGFTIEASEGDKKYGFATFLGRPIFVDHNNSDPKRARGVIVDAKLHVLDHKTAAADDEYWGSKDADPEHLPPTQVELLLEVDAKQFPKFAKAIVDGDLDGFSMGCFVAGTPITLEDGTQKPIEEIETGDSVITRTGETEVVLSTMRRPHRGIIYDVATYGQSAPMLLTPEHPVWARRIPSRNANRKRKWETDGGTCKCGRTFDKRASFSAHLREVNRRGLPPEEHSISSSEFYGWVEAQDLKIGDYLLTPRLAGSLDPPTSNFARLLGYYIAEGNLGRDRKRLPDGRPVFVEWTFNENELEYLQEVRGLLEADGYVAAGPYSKNGSSAIRCNNPDLAAQFQHYGGEYFNQKRLRPEVLRWDVDHQRALVFAYFNGDGCYRKNRVESGTGSKKLAEQLYLIASRCGLPVTPPVRQHSPSAQRLGHSEKYVLQTVLEPSERAKAQEKMAFVDEAGTWRRITDLSIKQYEGDVFNFDVGGDDSYVANDIAVHNCDVAYSICSHCGNKATDANEYCSHIVAKGAEHDFRTADGKRMSKRSYENCYRPAFFEISGVFDPADKTALTKEVRASVIHEGELYNALGPQDVDPIRENDPTIERHMRALIERGVTPQAAAEIAIGRGQPRAKMPGAGEGLALDFIPRHQYTPLPGTGVMPEVERNDPRWSSTHTAEGNGGENPLPQSMHTTAPNEVDTLRKEKICPICGNEMSGETCDVCSYVTPPEGFGNPDLDKAKKIKDEMAEGDMQAADGQAAPGEGGSDQGPPQGPAAVPKQPGSWLGQPTKSSKAAGLNVDMRWRPVLDPKVAAKINKREVPNRPVSKPATNEPKETVVGDPGRPVTSAMLTARALIAAAKKNPGGTMSTRTADGSTPPGAAANKRVDVGAVGGYVQDSNEMAGKPDGTTSPTGIGGTGVEGVEADEHQTLKTAPEGSDNSGFEKGKNTGDSGKTDTWHGQKGQQSPVTSEVPFWGEESKWSSLSAEKQAAIRAIALDDSRGDMLQDFGGGTAVQGVQPIDSVGKANKRVNVLEHTTTPANNSGKTDTWHGTDGNKVNRQQDPVTKVPTKSDGITSKIAAIIRLTDVETDMGLLDRDDKWTRFAELEAESEENIVAQLHTLARVKTAGLSKSASISKGAKRLPSFRSVTAAVDAPVQETIGQDQFDSGLFS